MAEHLLHVSFQILLRIDFISDAADCKHQGLFDPEVYILPRVYLFLILVKVFHSKSQKFREIVRLWVFDLFLLFSLT